MRLALVALSVVILVPGSAANLVVPTSASTQEGSISGTFPGGQGLTVQQLYFPAEMPGLNVGDLIVGMRLRLDSSIIQDYPIGNLTWDRFDILLGVGQSSLGLTYANNYVGLATTVRSGSIDFSAPAPFFPATGGPNGRDWSELISFSTPYTYTGGNLVIETRTVTPMNASLVIDVMGSAQTMTQNIVTLSDANATMADAGLGVRQRGWAINFEVVAVPEPGAWKFGGVVGLCTAIGFVINRVFRNA